MTCGCFQVFNCVYNWTFFKGMFMTCNPKVAEDNQMM